MNGFNELPSKVTKAILPDHIPDGVETEFLFEVGREDHGFVFAKLEIKPEILDFRFSIFDMRLSNIEIKPPVNYQIFKRNFTFAVC